MSSLPKAKYLTQTAPLVSINDTFTYRPFNVGELKLLLMIKDTVNPADDTKLTKEQLMKEMGQLAPTFTQVLTSVVSKIGKDKVFDELRARNLPSVDVTWMLLKSRIQASGHTVDVDLECPHCKKTSAHRIDLNDVKPTKKPLPPAIVKLDDEYSLELRIPPFIRMLELVGDGDGNPNRTDALCLSTVFNQDTVWVFDDKPFDEVVEYYQSLPMNVIPAIEAFLSKAPELTLESKWKCKHCQADNTLTLQEFSDFFY